MKIIFRRETFTSAINWLREARENGNPHMSIVLVGNKLDLESERQVSTEEGEKFARDNGLIFVEASAKTALNVLEAFKKTAENIYTKIDEGTIDPTNEVFFVIIILGKWNKNWNGFTCKYKSQ